MTLRIQTPGPDLHAWARNVARVLQRDWGQLQARDTGQSAAEDGALMWDRTGYPVVTRGGGFRRLQVAVSAPATAASAGTAGDIAHDADYVYVCVAANTWKRAALSTW